MRRMEGRTAVVTGAASGIGRATALELARSGCEVAGVDVNEGGLRETIAGVEAAGRRGSAHLVDVADREAMTRLPEAVLAAHGHVHILVNNAGVAVDGSLLETSFEDLDWIVGVNFWGVVHGCKVFLPHMLREDEAHVANVSSLFGLIGVPRVGAYCATKAAVRSISETLAAELRGRGVGVTSVHPGAVATRIIEDARIVDPDARSEVAMMFERHGIAPEKAAAKIVRAIRRGRPRLRICAETYVADVLKRAFPNGLNRLVGWGYAREEARRAAEA